MLESTVYNYNNLYIFLLFISYDYIQAIPMSFFVFVFLLFFLKLLVISYIEEGILAKWQALKLNQNEKRKLGNQAWLYP